MWAEQHRAESCLKDETYSALHIYIMEIVCYIKENIQKFQQNSTRYDSNTHQRKNRYIKYWKP